METRIIGGSEYYRCKKCGIIGNHKEVIEAGYCHRKVNSPRWISAEQKKAIRLKRYGTRIT